MAQLARIAGILLMLCAVLCTVGMLITYSRTRSFVKTSQETMATVIGIDENTTGGTTTYAPVLKYEDSEGKEHTAKPSVRASWKEFSVGDEVKIFYDPANPDRMRVDRLMYLHGMELFFGVAAAIIGLPGLIVWVVAPRILTWLFGTREGGSTG